MKRKIFYFLKTKEEYDYMLSNNLIPKRGIVFIESTHEIYRNKVLYSGYGPLKTYFESLKTELLSSIQDNKSEFNSGLSLLDLQLQEEFEDYNSKFLTNIDTISELIRAALSALSTSDNVINKTIIPTLENFDSNLKKLDNKNLQLQQSINSVSETSSLFKTNLSNLVNDVKNLGTKHNKDINNLLNYIKNDILSLITKQNTSNYNSLKDYINNQILQTKLTDSLLKAKVLEFSNISEVQKSLKSQISNLETLLMNQILNKDSDIRNLITTTDAKLRTYVDNKVSNIIANYDELLNNTGGNSGGNTGGNSGGSSSSGINLSAYATKDYVNSLISSIKVGNLDLSNYATKTYVNDKTKIDSVVKLGDKYLAIERGLLYVDIEMLKSALGGSSGGSSGGTNPSGGETNPSGGGSDNTDWSDEIDKIKRDIDIIKNYTKQDIEDEVKDIMDNYVDVLTKIKEGKLAWNEIFHDDGWKPSIQAYLLEIGVILKKELDGTIVFDWSGIKLELNEISSLVESLRIFVDDAGNPTSYEELKSQIINSVENDTAISKMKSTYSTFFNGEEGLRNLDFVFSEIGTLANKKKSLTRIINLHGDNLATIKTQSDANKALIEALSLYTGYKSGNSFRSTIDGAVAEIFAVNSTDDIMAKIQASIKDDNSIINLISNKVVSNGDFYAPKVISSNDDMITYIEAGLVKIQSRSNSSCGIFALNSNNEIVLLMYDKDGKCILNLGGTPNALVNGKWRTIKLKRVGTYNTIFHNSSILSMTATESDCTPYHELNLGKVTNANNIILYYLPNDNGHEITDEITISRDLHIFTSTSSTSSGINSLSFIPDGKYIRPNNRIFEEIAETSESMPQPVVIVYVYKDGILEKTETVKLSNN